MTDDDTRVGALSIRCSSAVASRSDAVHVRAGPGVMVATAEDMAMTVHPHRTLGEALMEASAAALGHAIHIVNR